MEADILKVASDKKGISHYTDISSLHQQSVKENIVIPVIYIQQNILFFSYLRESILLFLNSKI